MTLNVTNPQYFSSYIGGFYNLLVNIILCNKWWLGFTLHYIIFVHVLIHVIRNHQSYIVLSFASLWALWVSWYSATFLPISSSFPVVDPTPDNPLVSVILVSLLPILLVLIVVVGMFYWYRAHRQRMLNQEWESSIKKRKSKAGGLDCSDACAIMMDDDRSDSSSTHANNLNHNTEPLPIELDLLVQRRCILELFCQAILLSVILTKHFWFYPRWEKVVSPRYTRLS